MLCFFFERERESTNEEFMVLFLICLGSMLDRIGNSQINDTTLDKLNEAWTTKSHVSNQLEDPKMRNKRIIFFFFEKWKQFY